MFWFKFIHKITIYGQNQGIEIKSDAAIRIGRRALQLRLKRLKNITNKVKYNIKAYENMVTFLGKHGDHSRKTWWPFWGNAIRLRRNARQVRPKRPDIQQIKQASHTFSLISHPSLTCTNLLFYNQLPKQKQRVRDGETCFSTSWRKGRNIPRSITRHTLSPFPASKTAPSGQTSIHHPATQVGIQWRLGMVRTGKLP